jgi:hypothetical protein
VEEYVGVYCVSLCRRSLIARFMCQTADSELGVISSVFQWCYWCCGCSFLLNALTRGLVVCIDYNMLRPVPFCGCLMWQSCIVDDLERDLRIYGHWVCHHIAGPRVRVGTVQPIHPGELGRTTIVFRNPQLAHGTIRLACGVLCGGILFVSSAILDDYPTGRYK